MPKNTDIISLSISPNLRSQLYAQASCDDMKISPWVNRWLVWITENELDYDDFTIACKEAGLCKEQK